VFSLVYCLCLSFVVVVVSFIFLPSVFFNVCFFIMPLNPLSVFDHMTISMDRSMYRKHNMICLYRTELFQKNITTLRNCSFLMGYFNPSKSICTSFRSVFLYWVIYGNLPYIYNMYNISIIILIVNLKHYICS
jgi:hypothetical protein